MMARCRFKFIAMFVYFLIMLSIYTWCARAQDDGCRIPRKGVGSCVNVEDCEPILTFMQQAAKPLSEHSVKLLSEYVCGSEGNNPKVCCPPPGPISGGPDSATVDDKCNCVNVRTCEPILTFFKGTSEPLRQEDIQALRKYACGYEGTQPKVCCPSGPVTLGRDADGNSMNDERPRYSSDKVSVPPPDISEHRNLNLLPRECGQLLNDDKVESGGKTFLFQFPWMVLLSYRTKNGNRFQCGGTIVNDRYILTAARCIKNASFPLIAVRIGEHDTESETDCEVKSYGTKICAPPVQDLLVEETIPHPQYTASGHIHDIGLLRVARMDLTKVSSRPVCLPLNDLLRNFDLNNRRVVATGWGADGSGNANPVLIRAEIPVVSNEKCTRTYQTTFSVSFRQLCTLKENSQDSCTGDIGGPLHVVGVVNGDNRFVQQGIISFKPRNCQNDPGVHTRVAYYMDWILDSIRE